MENIFSSEKDNLLKSLSFSLNFGINFFSAPVSWLWPSYQFLNPQVSALEVFRPMCNSSPMLAFLFLSFLHRFRLETMSWKHWKDDLFVLVRNVQKTAVIWAWTREAPNSVMSCFHRDLVVLCLKLESGNECPLFPH